MSVAMEITERLSFEQKTKAAEFLRNVSKDGRITKTSREVAREVTDLLRRFVSEHQVDHLAKEVGIVIRSEAAERAMVTKAATIIEVPPEPPKQVEQRVDVQAVVEKAVAALGAKLREEHGTQVTKIHEQHRAELKAAYAATEERLTAAFHAALKELKNEMRHTDDAFLDSLSEQEEKVGAVDQQLQRTIVALMRTKVLAAQDVGA